MTDETRIQRLTELARRVYPLASDPYVSISEKHGSVMLLADRADFESELLTILHPEEGRADGLLDALEAALLVLAHGTEARVISVLDIRMDDTLKANAERLGCPVEALTELLDAHKAWERARGKP